MNRSHLIKSCTFCAALFICAIVQAQTFDFYAVKNAARNKTVRSAPVVVFVHGGAWLTGDKSEYKSMAQNFTQNGVCFAAINYRLAPVKTHPQPVEDLKQVLTQLQDLKNEPRCDLENIYLVGHSAGAHMIAYWATQNEDSRVKGLIGISGIYDLTNLAQVWPNYVGWFLKPEFGEETKWPAASPTRLEMKCKAPWILIHSKKDELVDQKQSLDFLKVLQKQKIEVDFSEADQGTHFGTVEKMSRKTSVAAQKIIQFVRKKKS